MRRFAGELPGALSDENRRGFTPIVYAIKVSIREEQAEMERRKNDEMNMNIRALYLPIPELLFQQETGV